MNQRGAGGVSAAGGATRRAGSSAQPSALRQRFFGGLFGGSSRSPSPMAAQFRGGGDLQSISATQASAAAHGAPSSRVAAAAGGGGGQQDADTGRGASTAVATLVRQHNGGSGEDGGNEGGSAGVEAGAGQDRWSTIQEPMRFDIDLGYRRDIRAEYDVDGDQIGKGGNGKVVVVTHRESGKQFACKIIPKVLDSKRHTERKCRNHLASLQREISVLQALRGSLSVVELHNVFEDEDHVWIVMEWCKGGELRARISERFYSERTVASFLRGVLRTVAVMHNHHILHRDIKPGNFMLLNDSDRSPLKAIDFGLATPFDPDGLPISTLGLEGTPWYMAPEVLNHSVTPASDLWSIGVMAAELLTGKMPFDDHKNPRNARLSAIWGSILSDELDMRGHAWNGISDDAKMFVASLLQRDPSKRPTAKEALRHPWLKGDVSDRSQGRQLQRSVVQRIQRFGQGGVLQRAVLQGIVQDLLTVPAAGGSPCSVDGDGAACRGRVCDPTSALLEPLYAAVGLQNQSIGIADLADRLKTMGFKLEASEMARLLEQLDVGSTGSIGRAAFAASQLDWKALQNNDPEEWARVAGDAFRQLDEDDDGILSTEDIATVSVGMKRARANNCAGSGEVSARSQAPTDALARPSGHTHTHTHMRLAMPDALRPRLRTSVWWAW